MAESFIGQGLKATGLLTTTYLTYKALSLLYMYALQPCTLEKYLHGKRGHAWALITGASDGIGLGFAHALSAAGFNIILHGRNPSKLATVQSALQAQYPSTSYRLLIIDGTHTSTLDAALADLASTLSDLPGPLTLLINNAGGVACTPFFKTVPGSSHADIDATLDLNARFPAQLTRALLPTLQASAPAFVINMASVTGLVGMPFIASYSGAKAFLYAWTAAVQHECQMAETDVQSMVVTIGKASGVSWQKGASAGDFWVPDARVVARCCLDRVGCGRIDCTPYWPHWAQVVFLQALPYGVRDFLVKDAMRKEVQASEKEK